MRLDDFIVCISVLISDYNRFLNYRKISGKFVDSRVKQKQNA